MLPTALHMCIHAGTYHADIGPVQPPSTTPPPTPPARSQAGKQKGNTAVGRYLAETVAAVPHFTKADFEKMMADQSNDCTLVRGAPMHWPVAAELDDLGTGTYQLECISHLCPACPFPRALPQLPSTPAPAALQVLFLSKLIQAHLALADKLGTMQLPLL